MTLNETGTFKMTRQRKAILDELKNLKTHPTADEIYRLVKKKIPRISLGTVYRTLELFSERGIIQVIQFGGMTQRRFDGDLASHHHVRCVRCGRVDDVPPEAFGCAGVAGRNLRGYRILGSRVEIFGICPSCRRKEKRK